VSGKGREGGEIGRRVREWKGKGIVRRGRIVRRGKEIRGKSLPLVSLSNPTPPFHHSPSAPFNH